MMPVASEAAVAKGLRQSDQRYDCRHQVAADKHKSRASRCMACSALQGLFTSFQICSSPFSVTEWPLSSIA